MKTVHCVVYAFFVFCALDITRGRDFSDIWRNLPRDFGNVVNNAWNSIVKAIQAPVEDRKHGRRRKKATTTSTTTTESYEIISTPYEFPTDIPRRPTIPIITQPKWRSLLDWRILQRPNLVKLAQAFSNRGAPSMYEREVNSCEGTTLKLTTNDEDNHFEINCNFNSFVMNMPQKIMEAFKQSWTLIKDSFNNLIPTKNSNILEHYTIHKEESEGQGKKINIPVIPTPKYRYEYLWRPKYTNQFLIVPYSKKNPANRAFSADETFNHFHSTEVVTTTEETASLLKELKFGKYRLKIFYKLLFD